MRQFLAKLSPQSLGVLYMAIASIFFFMMGLMVKLARGIPISQIIFFRAFVALILCLIQLKISRVSLRGNRPRLLLLRGLFGTLALILFFKTLHQLPMATAVTIQYLSPIFTAFLTAIFLKEIFYSKQIIFFGLSFLGVLFIKGFTENASTLPYYLGLIAAGLSACAYTTIRKIGNSEHPLVIILYFPLVTLPLIAPFVYMDWVWPTSRQWIILLGVGFFVQIAQYFMTRAYQLGEGSVVSITGYLGVIWAAIGGHLWFNERLEIHTYIGIGFVVLGVIGNTYYRRWKVKYANTPLT